MARKCLMFIAAALVAWASPAQAQYSESLGDFDYGMSGPYPLPPVYIGTFSPGASLLSATISGTYGSDIVPSSTAGFDLFLDGILVAQCVYLDPGCWVSGDAYRPWSYSFSGAELSIFDDGVADLTVVQTSPSTIRLGSLTLEGVYAVPEPSSMLLLGTGLIGLVAVRRRREGFSEA